ncbi:MAG TPA: hypothetical protein VFZ65_14895 [Planctomycetota bacterium]|nr:hypothetical protein [Planctomycetota bacterium]
MMAEQLRHAPWLLVSVAAHAIALVLLWLLMPPVRARAKENAVAVTLPDEVAPVLPPPPVDPVPVVEPIEPTVVLDPVEVPVAAPDDAAATSDVESREPADAGTTLIGLNPIFHGGVPGRPGHPGGPGGGGGCPQKNIDAALEWLARHQDGDGRWDCDGFMKHDVDGEPCDGPGNAVHDVGVTGLALLAMLGDGNSLRQGRYRDQVRRATLWLRDQQQENGRIGGAAASDFVYDHAIATYALCEAFGLSAYETLRPTAQGAIDYLQAHRNPYGAWRYQPRDGDSDTSVTGWCVLAMCSGKHFGLQIDDNALRLADTFLESCTSPDGQVGYRRAGELSARRPGKHGVLFPPERTDALTAVGLFCRFFLGQDPAERPVMRGAAGRLQARVPSWDSKAGVIDFYYWYYGSYAMFQVGGPAWREWAKALGRAILPTQLTAGNAKGSWDPIDAWGEDGGRVYSTAILALTLQVYYRYGRLVRAGR